MWMPPSPGPHGLNCLREETGYMLSKVSATVVPGSFCLSKYYKEVYEGRYVEIN